MGDGAPQAQLPQFFTLQARINQLRSGRVKEDDDGTSVPIPDCLDWRIEWVLLHERNRATRYEVTELWSLEDLARATLALSLHDEAVRRAEAKAKHDAELAKMQRELTRR